MSKRRYKRKTVKITDIESYLKEYKDLFSSSFDEWYGPTDEMVITTIREFLIWMKKEKNYEDTTTNQP